MSGDRWAAGEWVRLIRAGDLRALARTATAVENQTPLARAILTELFPYTGKSCVIGITGAPGAGKSTLVDQMTRILRLQGKRVAILAVDPSSPYSGGAILGDRIRMQAHHADPAVFIRSMATRGWLGGLARHTTDLALLLDGAGFDTILIETVGVGQDEVEVARLADLTLVILVPNMGDDVQAIKAGIMEIADIFVINKSDQPGADRLEQEIRSMQSLSHAKDGFVPSIVWTVANQNCGVEKLLEQVEVLRHRKPANRRSVDNWTFRLRGMLRDRLLQRISNLDLQQAAERVASRSIDPYSVLDQLVQDCIHG